MKLIDIKELEVVLKDAKSSKIKLFHKLIFDEDGDRNNRKGPGQNLLQTKSPTDKNPATIYSIINCFNMNLLIYLTLKFEFSSTEELSLTKIQKRYFGGGGQKQLFICVTFS